MSLIFKRIIFLLTIVLITFTSNYSQKQQSSGKEEKLPTAEQPGQNEDEFTRVIRLHKAKPTSSKIIIKLKSSDIETRELNTLNGKSSKIGDQVLSIPVEIINCSNRTISTYLKHEWYGGIVIYPDLLIAVQKPNDENLKIRTLWETGPGFQIGYADKSSRTVLRTGNRIKINVRLNYPGTGSEPHERLIDGTQAPQEYLIKFLLFFEGNNSKEYLLTQPFKIKLKDNLKK